MITKDNNLKVMELFFKHPTTFFHLRKLSRATDLSSAGVIKIVRRLKDQHLLTTEKIANLEQVKPTFSQRFYVEKRLNNINSLYDTGLIEHLKKTFEMPRAIVLFGSYADGTDTEQSDIDIAVIGSKKPTPGLERFEKILARNISIHSIDLAKTSKGFKNSLANGVVLEGFLELVA